MWTNLGDLIDRSKPRDAIAIVDCSRTPEPLVLSYGDLDEQVRACAGGLRRSGLQPGESVAIMSTNRAEFLVAYLAIMQAGLVAVPVNHKLARETIDFVLRDCNAKLVFVDTERRRLVPDGIRTISFDDAS